MRYLVTIKLNDGLSFILIPEFSRAICSQWKSERTFNLSSTTNRRSRWVFPSPFSLKICTVNCTTETEGIFWEKAALNPLVSRWSVPFEFSFCEGKTRLIHAIAANKRANSHNFKIKKNWIYSQWLSSPFTQWTEINIRTWMNRWWEWIMLSVRSLTVFEENIVVTVLAKLVPLFFKCSYAFFYLPLSNWQVSVCDRYFFTSPLNSSGQIHRKPLLVKPAWQAPPFKHGPPSQWFWSIRNIK